MNITLIIPVYNYERRIARTLSQLRGFAENYGTGLEIIFVDDGSTDSTVGLLSSLSTPFRLLRLKRNSGKGAAVKAGIAAARGSYVFFTDADLPYELDAIHTALGHLTKGVQVVLGSRELADSSALCRRSLSRRLSSYIFSRLANLVLLHKVADTQCGFKGFDTAVAKSLFGKVSATGFIFDVELIYEAQQAGHTVALVPVRLVEDSDSSVRLLRDSLRMFYDLIWLYARTRRTHLMQFVRYGTIGVYNTLLNFAIFNALIVISGVSTGAYVVLFSFIAFVIVIVQSFFINKKWVFKSTVGSHGTQFRDFFLVSGVVALINLGLIQVIVNVIGAPAGIGPHLWANIALFLTIIVSVIGNFCGYKFIVFRHHALHIHQV